MQSAFVVVGAIINRPCRTAHSTLCTIWEGTFEKMKEKLYQLWLISLPKISGAVARRLHEHYGSFEAVYHLTSQELSQNENLSLDVRTSLCNKNLDEANNILGKCEVLGADIISYYDDEYPERLRQIPDPPLQLYVKGTLPPIDGMFTVAVVGARKPSVYGSNNAGKIAFDLATAGALVVSGMARGIDSAAHRGALRAEADTVAVLGCGIDVVYPPENGELKKLIECNGAVITECPPGTPPLATNFPARNRIISGMSSAVLIVEGKATSGSTITGNLALDQGREVFCLPGNIDSPMSVGPNMLIREGGRLITCAGDIITDMSSDYPELMVDTLFKDKVTNKRIESLTDDQKKIMSTLTENHPIHLDEICYNTKIEVAVVNQCLFMLELDGMVRQLPGKNYVLTI